MGSLLQWSLGQSSSDALRSSAEMKGLDSGIIDMILNKPDSVLMKEALAIGLDEKVDEEARVTALDDLEMLVEQMDNAKDLTPLGMYPQIISLLDQKHPDRVRMQALWVLGTAVQNNPEAQSDFLEYDPIPLILSILSPSTSLGQQNVPSNETRSKAAYTLCGSLKRNADAVNRLDEVGGWDILKAALCDSDITIRRKLVFLINSLLMPITARTFRFAPLLLMAPPPEYFQPREQSSSTAVTALSNHASSSSRNSKQDGLRIHNLQDKGVKPVSTTASVLSALQKYQVIPIIVESLVSPLSHCSGADKQPDPGYTEKAAKTLITYLEVSLKF
ncbi:hypothetical protein M422DRAFT_188272 [Sphaerobolus stellatus SS14]|uniref:Nucleotide exchange factor Fes1 domain-containing protein n=1 Tax=Sphaerobolus stellatus (strain SS14) TaxID=990650 RepID=A0A0C9U5H9_SPHS4|nr:hypothetical protein M422DRAFT_188272 [Sphaerobolus stellatus SS14]